MDRKSPVGTSAANSPRKPQSSRDQSDEDTGAGGDSQVGQSTGGDGKSGTIDYAILISFSENWQSRFFF